VTASSAPFPSSGPGNIAIIGACLIVGVLTTVGAAIYGNGSLLLSAVPLFLLVALVAAWFAPLRIPLLLLVFANLVLDGTGEGPWTSPLARLGDVFIYNLNLTVPIGALAVTGTVALLLYLCVIQTHRQLRGFTQISATRTPSAAISLQSMGVSSLAVFALVGWGTMTGGNLQMAKIQVQAYVTVLMLAFLCAQALEGPRDYKILGVLVVFAAIVKALIAVWVVNTVVPPFEMQNGKLAFATSHGDSMLFATAAVLLIVRFAERPQLRVAVTSLPLLGILTAGMLANNRRLVWVELAAGVALYFLVSRRTKAKLFVMRAVILAIPLIVVYIGAGWNSSSQVFAPVRTFRSVGDSDVDASTKYRDLENFNLIQTMRLNPLTGTGFGHPFAEVVLLPTIAAFFKEYLYMPHNSILGLWAYTGPFGFSGLMLAPVVAVYLAARSYRRAVTTDDRIAAFMVLASVLIYLMHCWGDLGFSERKSIVLVGPALGIAGQLALSTGAWRIRPVRQLG
jgi:hypothetical protein